MYLSGIVDGNSDFEPQNRAQKQRDFHDGKGHVHQATALAKTRGGGVANGSAREEDLNGNIKQQHGHTHAKLQQLADVYQKFVLGEVAKHIDCNDGKAQYDCSHAVVVAAGVNVGSAVRLKKLGSKFANSEAHNDLLKYVNTRVEGKMPAT